ncbi:MAG: hypothetical protein ACREF5_01605 [Candidatus Saccharimonadales bacterium]
MENYSTYYQNRNRRQLFSLNIIILALLILCGIFIFLIVHGYSTVQLDVPAGMSINVNNHTVTTHILKMRPGSYQIIISSPTITPYQGTLHVGLFGVTKYKPTLRQRNASAIASSVIGAVGTAGSPQVVLIKWFDNNTWFVGLVAPEDIDLAMHYNSSQRQWSVGFYNANSSGYPANLSSLPDNVAAYVQNLETQHAGG